MKVIIAGSRDITDYELLQQVIAESRIYPITEVVSGGCRGVDMLGERWARENSIPVKRFPADWNAHGKKAGPIRNGQMATYADSAIVIHTGGNGSADMMDQMKRRGKRLVELNAARKAHEPFLS